MKISAPPGQGGGGGGGGPDVLVHKLANEIVNNSSVYQDDDDLVFPVAANEIWAFYGFLRQDSDSSADFKHTWSIPTGAVGNWAHGWNAARLEGRETLTIGTVYGTSGIGEHEAIPHWGLIVNGANAGNMQLQWAQNSSHASDCTVYKGSWLMAWKLN